MATKVEIQAGVIELSGRQDLTEDMYNNVTKFEFFLDAGLRLLDTAQKTPESKRWLMKDIAIGDHQLTFQNARAIHEVWIANADGRIELERVTLRTIRTSYSNPPADITSRQPVSYAPDTIHIAPQQRALTAGNFTSDFTYDYHNILFGDSYGFNGIVWMPPTDVVYTVEILADFFSILSADSDQNYWSVQYPNVLIQAVLFSIEVYYRNTAGMRDYLESLKPFLTGIDHDLAEQEAADLNQMEG